MRSYLLVFVGAGIGGVARYALSVMFGEVAARFSFPIGTLVVNVSGSFMMGLIAGYFLARGELPPDMRLFLMTGIVGGYATFAGFSLDCVIMLDRGEFGAAMLYIATMIILSTAAIYAAILTVKTFL